VELPERYPPYQTCHRRYQRWVREGAFERILEELARDRKERGNLDLSECFIDGTFIVAKKRGGCVGPTKRGKRVKRSHGKPPGEKRLKRPCNSHKLTTIAAAGYATDTAVGVVISIAALMNGGKLSG
jgi:hypothetical protein